jgi:dGTPase
MLINREVTDLVTTAARNLRDQNIRSLDDVRACEHRIMRFSDKLEAENRVLKDFLMEKMYRHWRLIRMTEKARRILTSLFEAYIDDPKQLPPKYAKMAEEESPAQVICDYVAGMTDRFALLEHQKLFDPMERV